MKRVPSGYLNSLSSLFEQYVPSISAYIDDETTLSGSLGMNFNLNDASRPVGKIISSFAFNNINFNGRDFGLASSLDAGMDDDAIIINSFTITSQWIRLLYSGSISYVIPLYDNGSVAGYIEEIVTSGYGGEMTVIASYSADGTVLEAQMMANSETPGLGKKAEESWYMDMFRGLGGESPLPLSKSDLPTDQAAAVSGASITFGGVSSAIHEGSEYVKSLGGAV